MPKIFLNLNSEILCANVEPINTPIILPADKRINRLKSKYLYNPYIKELINAIGKIVINAVPWEICCGLFNK